MRHTGTGGPGRLSHRLADRLAAWSAIPGRHTRDGSRARPRGLRRDIRQAMRQRTVRLVASPLAGLAALVGVALWQPELLTAMASGGQVAGLAVFTLGLVAFGGLSVRRLDGPEWLAHLTTVVPVVVVLAIVLAPGSGPTRPDQVADASDQVQAAETSPAGPAEAVELANGPLRGISHQASGEVRLLRADRGIEIRLDDVRVASLPDLRLYVVPGRRATLDGATRLGDLRPVGGHQRLPVPTGSITAAPVTFLVWCPGARGPVAEATLLPTGDQASSGR